MNPTTVLILAAFSFVLICINIPLSVAGGKGSTYVLGGGGCNPGLVYKTHDKKGKKGETVVMNSGCHKEETEYSYIDLMPYPVHHKSYHGHGYGHGKRR